MLVLGYCPTHKCQGVDTIRTVPFNRPALKCSRCRVIWPDFSHGTLGVALHGKRIIPVETYYSRKRYDSRLELRTGIWVPAFLLPHPNTAFLIEMISGSLSSIFGLTVMEGGDSIAGLVGRRWEAAVELRWEDSPGELPRLLDTSNAGMGNISSREIMRYARKLFHIWSMEKLPTYGRGYVFKLGHSPTKADARDLASEVQKKMATTLFTFRDGRRPMDQPCAATPA